MSYFTNYIYKPYFWALLISSNALIIALFLEYIINMNPCHLCVIQRYAYCVTLILSLLAFIYKYKNIISILICLSMTSTIGIAFWHLGIELHWWLPSLSCSGIEKNIGSLTEELQNNLLDASSTRCDIQSPKFLRITLVQWSLIYIVVTTIFTINLTYRILTNKTKNEA